MARMEWEDDYSVGVDIFDDQHKNIIIYINDLYDAMKSREEGAVVGRILDNLIEYTMSHFLDEEIAMLRYGYPDFEAHKHSHDQFVCAVRSLYIRFHGSDSYSRVICAEIITLLVDWLKNHIHGVDKEYSAFFADKQVEKRQ